MTIHAYEMNFDGLVGMTHNFGGLSMGNEPSIEHEGQISNPRLAALQGLNKMKQLAALGIKQAVLPPQERPHLPSLRKLGFEGTILDILETTKHTSPWLLPHVSSSASMWAANSATVCPSIDSANSHVHFTPANLATFFHRSLEAETTSKIFRAIFKNLVFFEHHSPLPSSELFFDEGAANHTRFCKYYGGPGIQLFTFGICREEGFSPKPVKYPARQTKEASFSISKLHKLYPGHAIFAFQDPSGIDAGAFHHDMLGIGNQNVLLIHEKALWMQEDILKKLKKTVSQICDTELLVIEVSEEEIPLRDALDSYFFNSQLISLSDNSMALIAPESAKKFPSVNTYIQNLLQDNTHPITGCHYVDLSESLKNGGGPACLRLRVVLTATELAEVNPGVIFTENLYAKLVEHVTKHYPTRLSLGELGDPKLYQQSCDSLDELSRILNLGDIYSFQTS